MFNFAWVWCFLLLPIPFITVYWQSKRSKKIQKADKVQQIALKVSFLSELESLAKPKSQLKSSKVTLILASLIWVLLVISLARPQWVGDAQFVSAQGYDLMLAVDTSGSMQLQDLDWNGKPTDRLTLIKKLFVPFIESRQGDRLGLLFFGTHAYLQAPLTKDRQTIKNWLNDSFIGLAGTQTAIGDGIGLAVKKLSEEDQSKQPILILLTDGANNSGKLSPEIATELAQQANVKIYAIGIGSDKPMLTGNGMVSASYDLDETALQNIADKTGGRYFRARTNADLLQITQAINQLEPIEQPQESIRFVEEYYAIPLAVALILTLGLLIYRWRKE